MGASSYFDALATMVRRNRRRYGGYIVHVGISVILVGVAASSAFSNQADVRLKPGETATVGDYRLRYTDPTSSLSNEKIDFGAALTVSKDGRQVAALHPERSYFPSQDAAMGPIGRFFSGESTSEVANWSGLRRDVWVAMQPDLRFLMDPIARGNKRFADASPRTQAIVIGTLSQLYVQRRPSVTFRVIVNPMVTWIWLGGLIVLGGSIVALWPTALPSRRRMSSTYAARLGRELSRA